MVEYLVRQCWKKPKTSLSGRIMRSYNNLIINSWNLESAIKETCLGKKYKIISVWRRVK